MLDMFRTGSSAASRLMGLVLFLVFVYLVIVNYTGAVAFINAVGSNGRALVKTLQARDKE